MEDMNSHLRQFHPELLHNPYAKQAKDGISVLPSDSLEDVEVGEHTCDVAKLRSRAGLKLKARWGWIKQGITAFYKAVRPLVFKPFQLH